MEFREFAHCLSYRVSHVGSVDCVVESAHCVVASDALFAWLASTAIVITVSASNNLKSTRRVYRSDSFAVAMHRDVQHTWKATDACCSPYPLDHILFVAAVRWLHSWLLCVSV